MHFKSFNLFSYKTDDLAMCEFICSGCQILPLHSRLDNKKNLGILMIFIRKKGPFATTIILADSLLLNETLRYWPVLVAKFLFSFSCFLDIKVLRFASLGFQLYVVLVTVGLFISVRSNSHLVIQTFRTAGIHYTCITLKLYKEQFLISITICLFLLK